MQDGLLELFLLLLVALLFAVEETLAFGSCQEMLIDLEPLVSLFERLNGLIRGLRRSPEVDAQGHLTGHFIFLFFTFFIASYLPPQSLSKLLGHVKPFSIVRLFKFSITPLLLKVGQCLIDLLHLQARRVVLLLHSLHLFDQLQVRIFWFKLNSVCFSSWVFFFLFYRLAILLRLLLLPSEHRLKLGLPFPCCPCFWFVSRFGRDEPLWQL